MMAEERDPNECRTCQFAERDHEEEPCVSYLTTERTRCPFRQQLKPSMDECNHSHWHLDGVETVCDFCGDRQPRRE